MQYCLSGRLDVGERKGWLLIKARLIITVWLIIRAESIGSKDTMRPSFPRNLSLPNRVAPGRVRVSVRARVKSLRGPVPL